MRGKFMPQIKNLIGQRFHRLQVIEPAPNHKGRTAWVCKCDCGNTHIATGNTLMRETVKSCGCLKKEKFPGINLKHGLGCRKGRHPVYAAWKAMKDRCYGKRPKAHTYWNRGITVCEEWKNDSMRFISDMLPSWKPGLSLHRINNDLGYSLENCKWANSKEQARATTRNRLVTMNGETKCVSDWCSHLGIPIVTVYARVRRRGMTYLEALTTPKGRTPRKLSLV